MTRAKEKGFTVDAIMSELEYEVQNCKKEWYVSSSGGEHSKSFLNECISTGIDVSSVGASAIYDCDHSRIPTSQTSSPLTFNDKNDPVETWFQELDQPDTSTV